MKTLKLMLTGLILAALFAIGLTSCKKDKDPDTSSMQQLVADENKMSVSDDEAMNDVNAILSGGGQKSTNILPCNVTVDSATIIGDTIIYNITFNGLNCAGTRLRVGQAEVKKNVNTPWIQAGTTVFVQFINLHITRVSDNKSITLNGKKAYTNVSGGRISDLGFTATSIVHRVSGSLIATFDDNTTRTWTLARQRTFTGTMGNLWCTVDGFGSADGFTNLVAWGINRHGEQFYTQITQSVIRKQSCQWDPCAGVKVFQIPSDNKQATFTAGFDDTNQMVNVNGNVCPTKYRIDWIWNGNSGTIYRFL
ncbi:MAG TPA: hypothetical protein PKW80_11000 [Bacteroidales bacterium]|nr:hypothetical protein [Bacteroidales bacterium]